MTAAPARAAFTDSRAASKRALIIAAATSSFLEFGYERTSVDTIADRASVSKQTIYNYFGDKRSLFRVVLAGVRAAADTADELDDSLLRDPARFYDDLVTVGTLFLEVTLSEQVSAVRRLIVGEVARHPDLHQVCADQSVAEGPRIAGWLTHRLEVLAAAGVLDTTEPAVVAGQFFAQLSHDGQQVSAFGTSRLSTRQAAEISARAARLIVRAYAVSTPV
ncbi:TetR/AcrR family transcriptional regulator [Nocardia sp. AG03]|uniref:TetR/AcrR family transcriptional regulator n=1 Tax=Nocardia sp. AG03 TaxID=3025312 RepID=UPI0024183370|nr:TetR/AcrR family transcriptional regulator [Nocardia sp. AG03]